MKYHLLSSINEGFRSIYEVVPNWDLLGSHHCLMKVCGDVEVPTGRGRRPICVE